MKSKPFETNLANTVGTANTLEFCIKKGIRGYLFISSREIYGQLNEGQEFFYEDGFRRTVDYLESTKGK